MTGGALRAIRGGLIALVVAVVVVVVVTLRTHGPTSAASPSAPATGAVVPKGSPRPRQEETISRGLQGDREKWVLIAKSSEGSDQEELLLRGVTFRFAYVAHGQPDLTTVTSDECIYTKTRQNAVFQGHVVVQTGEGFELRTEQLVYQADKGLAKSDKPVTFQRKGVSGSSTGMAYDAQAGTIELLADVVLHVEDEKGPPADIRAGHAAYQREPGTLAFDGGSEVARGGDVLNSKRLLVFVGSDQVIYRAQANEDVVLDTSGGALLGSGVATRAKGPRRLTGSKLDMFFRPDRSLSEAVAGPDAELRLMPGPGEPREKRTLKARLLTFRFDVQDRIEELQAQRDTSYMGEPLPAAKGPTRTLTCGGLVARFEPATGDVASADFIKDVVFSEGQRRASGDTGRYEGATRVLTLREAPELRDEAQGVRLTAGVIDVTVGSGDVRARKGVRNTFRAKAAPPQETRAGLFQGAERVATCRNFEYDAQTKTSLYHEQALMRSGRDEVRAPDIAVQELADGTQKLSAWGGVVSLMHPQPRPGDKQSPAPLEARAATMVYEEARRTVAYAGDVVIRQGDIQTRSPEATLTLTADGKAIQKVVAGEPVEVRQGTRTATGARGTYLPSEETVTLVGDRVQLVDPAQQVTGQTLRFHVGDDRIFVDGEEIRSETVLKRGPGR